MRKIIFCLILCLPLTMTAQGTWEVPEAKGNDKVQKDKTTAKNEEYKWTKYLGNVVPEVDGQVEWQKTFTNNRSAEDNYTMMLDYLTKMTQEENQLPASKVQLVNKSEHSIVCHFEEWLVFTSSVLMLDQTRFIYTLFCECADNQVSVRLMRLSYLYDENRKGGRKYKAEDWITDKYSVNKRRTKLMKISGKFRRKTVDRMEEILDNLDRLITKE